MSLIFLLLVDGDWMMTMTLISSASPVAVRNPKKRALILGLIDKVYFLDLSLEEYLLTF